MHCFPLEYRFFIDAMKMVKSEKETVVSQYSKIKQTNL